MNHEDWVLKKKYFKALRAVVELHKPMESDLVKDLLCPYCFNYNYPCPTIQAIEKELQ